MNGQRKKGERDEKCEDELMESGALKKEQKLEELRKIEKIKLSDTQEDEHYVNLIRRLAIEDKISFEAAEILIRKYREEKNGQ